MLGIKLVDVDTSQDEPKEWQYHVNILKGEDDE